EEMRDEEIALEALGHSLDEIFERNRRGVGRDDRAFLAMLLDLLVCRVLDLELLEHDLDDPVALGELLQVVLEIAGGDEPRIVAMHERRRIGLEQPLDRAL